MALEKADVVMVTQQSSDGKGEESMSRRVVSRGSREVHQLSRTVATKCKKPLVATVISSLTVLAVSNPKSRYQQPPLKLLGMIQLYHVPVWQFFNGLWLHNSNLCTYPYGLVSSVCIEIPFL